MAKTRVAFARMPRGLDLSEIIPHIGIQADNLCLVCSMLIEQRQTVLLIMRDRLLKMSVWLRALEGDHRGRWSWGNVTA